MADTLTNVQKKSVRFDLNKNQVILVPHQDDSRDGRDWILDSLYRRLKQTALNNTQEDDEAGAPTPHRDDCGTPDTGHMAANIGGHH